MISKKKINKKLEARKRKRRKTAEKNKELRRKKKKATNAKKEKQLWARLNTLNKEIKAIKENKKNNLSFLLLF